MPPKRCAESISKTDSKRFKSSFKETITVKVGQREGEEQFIVYEDGICARSTFFKAACSERWCENEEKIVLLPAHDPDSFRVYLKWMYGERDLFGLVKEVSQAHADCVKAMSPYLHEDCFIRDTYIFAIAGMLWNLGDYLGDVDFLNSLIDSIHEEISLNFYSPTAIDKVFANTPKDCALQLYIVDYAADKLTAKDASHIEAHGAAFHKALLKELIQRRNTQECLRIADYNDCKYHNHDKHGNGNKEIVS